jgi:hypothetical protein
MRRGLGYLQSKRVAPPAHDLLRARMRTVAPLPSPDQSAFVGSILDQGAAGSCSGFGTVAALDQYQRANGIVSPKLASPLWLYKIARLQEWAGLRPDAIPALTDSGAEPDLLFRAAERLGLVSWEDYPYPTDPTTLHDEGKMARVVNQPVAPWLSADAYDLRGMQWRTIPVGPGSLDMIAQALQHRLGVAFGMTVDTAYMNSSGEVITRINLSDPYAGGHWQCITAVESGAVLKVRSSWGESSGKDGFYFLSRSVVENPRVCTEFVVVDFAQNIPAAEAA